MKNSQISIKEIARLSGVSVATVSRVINNNGRFSEETRKKVLDIIEKYQYNTNSIAKSLRMNKSNTIGIIVPDISNEFFSTIVHNIESYFFERGFSTFICNTDKSKEKEKAYIKSLDSKMVDGIICISGQEEIEDSILSRDIPIACIDRRPRMSKNLAMVESDHFMGGYLATKHLIEKGCKDIILLSKKSNLSSVKDRIEGYKKALYEYSYPFSSESIVETINDSKHNIDNARETIHRELINGRTFDGVFATNDWLALGVVRELISEGLDVPNDVKIVGFDDDTIASYSEIPLTTIRQNVHQIANVVSDVFYKLLTEEKVAKKRTYIKIPVELIERETT